MAKLSEKSRYQSRYAPGEFVTVAQYIAEFACENKARKDSKDLPTRFWKQKEWSNYFVMQVTHINRLLKKYPGEAIVRMLRKNRHIYSLGPKFVEPYIQKELRPEANAMQQMLDDIPFPPAESTENLPTSRKSRKSGLSKILSDDEEL